MKASLVKDAPLNEFCIDTGCTMSLIDRQYLSSVAPDLSIVRSETPIHVRGIGSVVHDSSEFVTVDFYIPGVSRNVNATAHLVRELHVVDTLKAKILVGMDILGPEGCDVLISSRTLAITSCGDFIAPITTAPKGGRIERSVRASSQTLIPPHTSMAVPVRLRGNQIPDDRDYLFEPKVFEELGPEGGLFAHITNANIGVVQVRNSSDEAFTVPKNFRIGTLQDYAEEGCYLGHAYEAHLAVRTNVNWLTKMKRAMTFGVALAGANIADLTDVHIGTENVLPNGVTVYGNSEAFVKISTIATDYPNIWKDIGETVKVPESEWMSIDTLPNAKPNASKVYPLGPEDREVVDKEFDEMHRRGKLEWTSRPTSYGYPVFVVWRTVHQNGEAIRKGRVVVDIRGLNKISEFDAYPMPLQSDILASVSGCKFISIMDCAGFFHQWLVQRKDRHKLTVVSHRGSEQWNVAVMGYRNSPAYVQRQIDGILRQFRTFARAYVDDIVVFSQSLNLHLQHLKKVFSLFAHMNIALKPSKTYLGYPTIALLGQKVSSLGLSAPSEKLEAISKLEFPKTLKHLETYLGKTGWLRQYVPYYAQKAEALQQRKTLLLQASPNKGGARKSFSARTNIYDPSPNEIDSFNQLQGAFSRASFLVHFNKKRQLYIDVDASKERGFGVMIYHSRALQDPEPVASIKSPPKRQDVEPIMFLSKTLSPAESRYWPTELEMAGLVWVVTKLHAMIRGSDHPTIVYTDHGANPKIANQTKMSTSSTDKSNLKLIRASTYLSQFRLDIRYKPGKSHIVPDALSRLPSKQSGGEDIDSLDIGSYHGALIEMSDKFRKRIQKGYREDPAWSSILEMLIRLEQATMKESAKASSTFMAMVPYRSKEKVSSEQNDNSQNDPSGSDKAPTIKAPHTSMKARTGIDFELIDGIIYHIKETPRLCLPINVEKDAFQLAHDHNSHAGQHRAYQRLLESIYMPRMSRKLRQYIKHCPSCQLNQTKRHRPYGELMPLSTPNVPFHTIAMDFVVALPGKYDAMLTVTCKYSRRLLLIPGLTTYKAEQWSDLLLDRLLLCDWGLPRAIISDRDPKFLSDFWKAMFAKLGTELLFSSAYHPQTDGLSERSNQTVEIALRYLISEYPEVEWHLALPALQARLNNAINVATGRSPNEVVYGFRVREALSALTPDMTGAGKGFTIEEKRFRHRQEAADSASFAAAKAKIYYDARHTPLLLNPGDKAFLRLNRGYKLPGKPNPKLSNQRTGPFPIKRRIGRLAYELELPPEWRVHPVISVAQLEPVPKESDPYARPRPTHPPAVEMEGDTEDFKSYEVEKLVGRRIRKFGRTETIQYLVRWLGYGSEHDTWRSLSVLDNSMELVEAYERQHPPESLPKGRYAKPSPKPKGGVPPKASVPPRASAPPKRGRGRPLKTSKQLVPFIPV